MASFNDIEIKQELRTCYINGKKALFHLWIKKKDILANEYIDGLVEFEDGTVEEVRANNIRFCDNKMKEYVFKECEYWEDKQ